MCGFDVFEILFIEFAWGMFGIIVFVELKLVEFDVIDALKV